MRVRTGHTPGDWTPNVPSPHVTAHFRIGGALVTAQRAPSVSLITPNEAARVARRLEANRMSRAAARPRCGQPVMGKGTWNTPSGELCARNPGHRARDGHASAETMRAHAIRRRTRQPRELVR